MRSRWVHAASSLAVLLAFEAANGAGDPAAPMAIVRQADAHRGLGAPYKFLADIKSAPAAPSDRRRPSRPRQSATVVEVHSADRTRQLIFVQAPTRGDVMLKAEDTVWLRPRRLHRLTRIPPDLRMFGGVSIADVVAVDLAGSYRARLRVPECNGEGQHVLDLEANDTRPRYARATYSVDCATRLPARLDFLAASGQVLKRIIYRKFASILGRHIATTLVVEDRVFGDVSTIAMSGFEWLGEIDDSMFTPEYLLAVPVLTGD